jgi:hypothetical protein
MMNAMVWVVLGGLAVLVTMVLLAAVARHKGDAGSDPDLGSISSSWLNENRAQDRDFHNR